MKGWELDEMVGGMKDRSSNSAAAIEVKKKGFEVGSLSLCVLALWPELSLSVWQGFAVHTTLSWPIMSEYGKMNTLGKPRKDTKSHV